MDNRALTVAEDPVRQAARQQLALDPEHTSVALVEALAKPAPPSLTEDERATILRYLQRFGGLTAHQTLKEKLANTPNVRREV